MSYTFNSDADSDAAADNSVRLGRPPAEILADLEELSYATSTSEATAASPGVDVMDLVFELINDVRSSFVLAMAAAGVPDGQLREVNDTVADYVSNQYGD